MRHGRLRDFAVTEVNARRDRGTDRKDILSKLFQVQAEKPKDFDDTAVMSMATTNIAAGSDTTAIAMRAVVYFLLNDSKCMAKLEDEIASFHAQGRLSDPVTLGDAEKMPYLQAVINEALRMHPAVGMSLPRVTPASGLKVARRFIPQGVRRSVISDVFFRSKAHLCILGAIDYRRRKCMGHQQGPKYLWKRCWDIQSRAMAEF